MPLKRQTKIHEIVPPPHFVPPVFFRGSDERTSSIYSGVRIGQIFSFLFMFLLLRRVFRPLLFGYSGCVRWLLKEEMEEEGSLVKTPSEKRCQEMLLSVFLFLLFIRSPPLCLAS